MVSRPHVSIADLYRVADLVQMEISVNGGMVTGSVDRKLVIPGLKGLVIDMHLELVSFYQSPSLKTCGFLFRGAGDLGVFVIDDVAAGTTLRILDVSLIPGRQLNGLFEKNTVQSITAAKRLVGKSSKVAFHLPKNSGEWIRNKHR